MVMKNKAPVRKQSDFIESASVTALMRSLLAEELGFLKNPDYLAEKFVTSKWQPFLLDRSSSQNLLSQRVPGCMNYHLVRTKQFDEFLLNWVKENSFGQIILLGAGLDSRGLRFYNSLMNFEIYELDLSSMLEYKEKIIKQLNLPCKSNFIPINFGIDNIIEVFAEKNILKNKPTLILWEGVTYFLDEKTVKDILSELNHYFTNELSVAFDYAYIDYVNGDLSFFGAKELNRELQEIGEPHIFGINPNEVEFFAKELNYRLFEHYRAVDLERKFLDSDTKIHGFHGIVNFKKLTFE